MTACSLPIPDLINGWGIPVFFSGLTLGGVLRVLEIKITFVECKASILPAALFKSMLDPSWISFFNFGFGPHPEVSGFTPGSLLKGISWWCSRDYLEYGG